MTVEETAAKLGDILAKRKALGKLRQELETSNPSHWLITEASDGKPVWTQSKITAWLKAGEAARLIERLTEAERVRLVELAGESEAPAIPPRPAGTPPPLPPSAMAGTITQGEQAPEPEPIPAPAPQPEKPAPTLPPIMAKFMDTAAGMPDRCILFVRLGDYLESYLDHAFMAAPLIGTGEHVGKQRGGYSIVSTEWKNREAIKADLHAHGWAMALQGLTGEIEYFNPPAAPENPHAEDDEEIPELPEDDETPGEPPAFEESEESEPEELEPEPIAQVIETAQPEPESERLQYEPDPLQEQLAAETLRKPTAEETPESLIARALALASSQAKPAPAPSSPAVDAEAVRAIVKAEIAAMPSHSGPCVTLRRADLPEVTIEGRQHFRFPLLLACLHAGVPALVVGPAGTGKTSAGINAARGLGMPFFPMPFSPMTTKADLLGFVDAGGIYRQSAFVDAFKNGGLFIGDEFDAARPDVAVILNGATANKVLTLPTGEVITAHPGFEFMACANTHGTGPDAIYCGRNRLDGATLDRFFTVEFPHDEGLEAHAIGLHGDSPDCTLDLGGIPTASQWLATVQAARINLAEAGAHAVISQRATIYGVALAAAGVGRHWLIAGLLAKGLKGVALDAVNRLQ